jgi:hypothetical protein
MLITLISPKVCISTHNTTTLGCNMNDDYSSFCPGHATNTRNELHPYELGLEDGIDDCVG